MQQVKKNEWVRFAASIVTTIRRVNTTTSSRISNRTKRARMMPEANADSGATSGFFTGARSVVRYTDATKARRGRRLRTRGGRPTGNLHHSIEWKPVGNVLCPNLGPAIQETC